MSRGLDGAGLGETIILRGFYEFFQETVQEKTFEGSSTLKILNQAKIAKNNLMF